MLENALRVFSVPAGMVENFRTFAVCLVVFLGGSQASAITKDEFLCSRVLSTNESVIPLALTQHVKFSYFTEKQNWLPEIIRNLFIARNRFETIRLPNVEIRFGLLMITADGSSGSGLSGVLFEYGRPVIVRNSVTLEEYFIEIKGAGLASGGYRAPTLNEKVSGTLMTPDGESEFESLRRAERARQNGAVLALGFQRFTTAYGLQEIVYRLLPLANRKNPGRSFKL